MRTRLTTARTHLAHSNNWQENTGNTNADHDKYRKSSTMRKEIKQKITETKSTSYTIILCILCIDSRCIPCFWQHFQVCFETGAKSGTHRKFPDSKQDVNSSRLSAKSGGTKPWSSYRKKKTAEKYWGMLSIWLGEISFWDFMSSRPPRKFPTGLNRTTFRIRPVW